MGSADKYGKLGNGYHWDAGWRDGAYGRWVQRVLQELPDAGRLRSVLDVGCGDGYPASVLAARGYTVIGVDELDGPLAVARERVPDVQFGTAWPDFPVEYVLALESIEHMTEIDALVAAVQQCSRYAIITAPLAGLDPYAVRQVDVAAMRAWFAGCTVEHLLDEGEHQIYKVTPALTPPSGRGEKQAGAPLKKRRGARA